MSTSVELRDILRRHAVGSQAELTLEVTTAAMVIRAVADNDYLPREAHIRAVRRTLARIDQVAQYRDQGQLEQFVDDQRVPRESLELVQVMARAAHRDDDHASGSTKELAFPVLDRLVQARDAIAVHDDKIQVSNRAKAMELAASLETLAIEVLSEAMIEDSKRTASYAGL